MFSCEYCEISKKSFFIEHLRWLLLEQIILVQIQVLKDYTAKLLCLKLRKHLNIRHQHMLYKVNVVKKMERDEGKYPCWRPASVISPYKLIKTRIHNERFPKYVPTFFPDSYFTKQLWATVRNLYLFSKPNNCYGRAVQGQLSKFIWRNTVTSFRTLNFLSADPTKWSNTLK